MCAERGLKSTHFINSDPNRLRLKGYMNATELKEFTAMPLVEI